MATSIFALALSLLLVGAAARPCKTIFFYTSTSYYHLPDSDSNSNSLSQTLNPNLPLQNPRFLTILLTTTTTRLADEDWKLGHNRPAFVFRNPFNVEEQADESEAEPKRLSSSSSTSMIPIEFYSSVTSSVRDRTLDIMSVVGALLFGVVSGVLTAATIYLIWSLFWRNLFDFEESDDEFDDADESSPKKMAYVALPAKVVDDDLKKPAPAPAVV